MLQMPASFKKVTHCVQRRLKPGFLEFDALPRAAHGSGYLGGAGLAAVEVEAVREGKSIEEIVDAAVEEVISEQIDALIEEALTEKEDDVRACLDNVEKKKPED